VRAAGLGPAAMSSCLGARPAWAVCLTYVTLALLYNAFTPIGEAPDEIGHFQYVRLVGDEHRLPGPADNLWEGHQAPLYYLAQAVWAGLIERVFGCRIDLAWLPDRVNPGFPHAPNFNRFVHSPTERVTSWECAERSYHGLRLLSTLLTVAMILFTFAILREALPASPTAVAVGGMLVALLPSHVAISAMLNNDALANLLIVATTYLVVVACRTGEAVDLARAAVLACLAAAAKLSGFYLFGLILMALVLRRDLLVRPLRTGRGRAWLVAAGACGLLPLFVLARNVRAWGDPFAARALEKNLAQLIAAGANPPGKGILHYYAVELPRLFAVWFPVSYGAVNFPDGGSFEVARWGMPLVVAGVLLSVLVRRRWRQVERTPLIILVAGFALFFATYCYPGYRYRWLQARYFFSQLPFLSLCAVTGLLTLWEIARWPSPRWRDRLLIAVTYVCLVGLNLLVLMSGVIDHLYRYVGATP